MKYERLNDHLRHQTASEVPMTFAEIEALIGAALPPSARKHRPWWSNNSANSAATHAWLDAGYETERVDMGGERLVFRRASAPAATVDPADPLAGLYGAMRGTVLFHPDVDLTAPIEDAWPQDD